MEPYLYHGIKWNNFELLMDILTTGHILSRKNLNNKITDKNNIFNGEEYVSLCQKSLNDDYLRYDYKSSYDDFIVGKPCLILKNNNFNLIFPNLISLLDKDIMSPDEWHKIIFKDDDVRYSYYMDELQVKDEVKLENALIAVGLPMEYINYNLNEEDKKNLFKRISLVLKEKYNNIPIIDSSRYNFADNEEEINKHILIK